MSRRTRQSAGKVSLFPFLAVLICAMGALILLLLVTTRRIRQQTLAAQQNDLSAEQLEPTVDDSPPAAPAPTPVAPEKATVPAAPQLSDVPLLPLLAADPPPPLPEIPDPTEVLQAQLNALEAEQREMNAALDQLQEKLAEIEADANSETIALENLQAEAQAVTAEKQRLNQLYVRLLDQQEDAELRAESLRQEIDRTRAQGADADSKFAVVPYDGASGTRRRPIIIECTEDSLSFASEGVTIRATDLDGFTPRFNPVVYASQALIRYWDRRDRMSSSEDLGKPYLLLIVRPKGTTSYYNARELLSGMRQPFGYELVTEDQKFTWPPSDLEASAICRKIVDEMLSERDKLYEVALQQGAELPKYSDEQGRFTHKEIERLKNPTREVTINGQRFARSLGGDRNRYSGNRSRSNSTSVGKTGPASSEPRRTSSSGRPTPIELGARGGSTTSSGSPPSTTGVLTQQQTAVTRADRMPEWLREGTARPDTSENVVDKERPDLFANDSQSTPRSPRLLNLPDNFRRNGSSGASTLDGLRSSEATPFSSQASLDGKVERSADASIDPNRPQWGARSPGGTIGFEHEVSVRVSTGQVNVGKDVTFEVTPQTTTDELRRLLAAAALQDLRSWGDPPRSFYWVPSFRFTVVRGATRQYHQLKSIVESWGLRMTVQYVAE